VFTLRAPPHASPGTTTDSHSNDDDDDDDDDDDFTNRRDLHTRRSNIIFAFESAASSSTCADRAT
jgi:hypothetical protein